MAKKNAPLPTAERPLDGKAREALELAAAAQRERGERMAADRARSGIGDALAAVLEPVAALVNADAAAVKAAAKLRSAIGKVRPSLTKKGRPSPGTPVSFSLADEAILKVPPYDSEWNWGNDLQHASSKASGYVGILGASGNASGAASGDVAAACGIGTAFFAYAAGQAVAHTQVHHTWGYQVEAVGLGSSADARGGIDLSAWKGGALVSDVGRAQVFHDSVGTAGKNEHTGSGTVEPADLAITFPVEAYTWYAVVVGAWVECKHSSGLGVSLAVGKVEGTVSCVLFLNNH